MQQIHYWVVQGLVGPAYAISDTIEIFHNRFNWFDAETIWWLYFLCFLYIWANFLNNLSCLVKRLVCKIALMKRVYLAIIKNRYLKIGLILLIASAVMAIYLNNEGINCLSELGRIRNMSLDNSQELEQLKGYCFFITNAYVYSLFGLIIGSLIIIVWYSKYRNVWRTKFDK